MLKLFFHKPQARQICLFYLGGLVLLLAGVGPAEAGLEEYRLAMSCEADSAVLFGKISEVVDRFGGRFTEATVPDTWTFSIPLLGGNASSVKFTTLRDAGNCQIKAVGAMTSPGVLGTPSKVTDVPPPRMEFLVQSLDQQLIVTDPKNPPTDFPRLDGRIYALQSLTVPYLTPFYIRDKVLGADKGVYMLAVFYVLMEASGILLLSTSEDTPGQRAIGVTGLVFGRVFALGLGPVFSKMNRSFAATGYSYDPKKRHRLR